MSQGDRIERHLMRQRGAGIRTIASNFGFSFAPVLQRATASTTSSPQQPRAFDHDKPLPVAPQVSPDISFDSQPPEKLSSSEGTKSLRTRKRHDFEDDHDAKPTSKKQRKDSFAQELRPSKPRRRPKMVEKRQAIADQDNNINRDGEVESMKNRRKGSRVSTTQSAVLLDDDELASPYAVPVSRPKRKTKSKAIDDLEKPCTEDASSVKRKGIKSESVKATKTRKRKPLVSDNAGNEQNRALKSSEALAKTGADHTLGGAPLDTPDIPPLLCNQSQRPGTCKEIAEQQQDRAKDNNNLPHDSLCKEEHGRVRHELGVGDQVLPLEQKSCLINSGENDGIDNRNVSEDSSIAPARKRAARKRAANNEHSKEGKIPCDHEAQPTAELPSHSAPDAVPANVSREPHPSTKGSQQPAKRRGRPQKAVALISNQTTPLPESNVQRNGDTGAKGSSRIPLSEIDANAKQQPSAEEKSHAMKPKPSARLAGHASPHSGEPCALLAMTRNAPSHENRKSKTDDGLLQCDKSKQLDVRCIESVMIEELRSEDPTLTDPTKRHMESEDRVQRGITQDFSNTNRKSKARVKRPEARPMPKAASPLETDASRVQPVDNVEWLFAPQNVRAGPSSKSRKPKAPSKTIIRSSRNMLGMPDMDLDDLLSNIAVFAGGERK